MHTIHTSSLTHEIYSYVPEGCVDAHATGLQQLREFIRRRYEELLPGGVWVNRDVVGPEHPERLVWLACSDRERFLKFAADYRRREGEMVEFAEVEDGGRRMFQLGLGDAWEFATKKDYLENWESEMHERFCFWSQQDWERELEQVGFRVSPVSRCYLNPWIVENRLEGQIELIDPGSGTPLAFPPTTTILVAEKI